METGVKEIELRDLWKRYKVDGDATARERLVVAYSPMVKFVAGRLGAGLPSHVEDADLISYGLMGLIGAIERFEPERGIKFETFAMTRIRGAIIDELRSLDWVPRSVRSRAREIEAAQAKLEHELQRAPTEAELAAKLGIVRGGTADLAARDRQLLGLRARRALDRLRLLRRPGLAARHDLRPAGRRPAGSARQQRGQGPPHRGDRLAARARAARRRPLLLREPDPAGDRRGPRGHRVAGLPAAHQGGDAAEIHLPRYAPHPPGPPGGPPTPPPRQPPAGSPSSVRICRRLELAWYRWCVDVEDEARPVSARQRRRADQARQLGQSLERRRRRGRSAVPRQGQEAGNPLGRGEAAATGALVKVVVNVDGGSRGNPGQAAIAAVVQEPGRRAYSRRAPSGSAGRPTTSPSTGRCCSASSARRRWAPASWSWSATPS